MILHINTNYVYSPLHATMLAHMPDPSQHVVFAPVIYNPQNVIWHVDQAPKYPVVHMVPCFTKLDRLLYEKKRRQMQQALERTVDLLGVRLIHAYTLFTDGDLAFRMHKAHGIPYVVAVRNSDVNFFFKHLFFFRKHGLDILKNAAAVFFLSKAYYEEVLSQWVPADLQDALRAKSRVIPNGIDDFWHNNPPDPAIFARRRAHRKARNLRLLYVGRIDRNKNIGLTQEARKILTARGVKTSLDVVGGIANPRVHQQLMRTPDTFYHPAEPKEDLISRFREADLFAMPSLTETFGLVYAEALSQGLPVLYSAGQGFDGQFPQGEVGYAVNPKSPESVADAVMQLLDDETADERALAGAPRFNWARINAEYSAVYRDILNA